MLWHILLGLTLITVGTIITILSSKSKHFKDKGLLNRILLGFGIAGSLAAVTFPMLQPPISNSDKQYIQVTVIAYPHENKDLSEAKRNWLTQKQAKLDARAELASKITILISQKEKSEQGQIENLAVESKTEALLQMSEVVDGKFLSDGSYQLTMRVPNPRFNK